MEDSNQSNLDFLKLPSSWNPSPSMIKASRETSGSSLFGLSAVGSAPSHHHPQPQLLQEIEYDDLSDEQTRYSSDDSCKMDHDSSNHHYHHQFTMSAASDSVTAATATTISSSVTATYHHNNNSSSSSDRMGVYGSSPCGIVGSHDSKMRSCDDSIERHRRRSGSPGLKQLAQVSQILSNFCESKCGSIEARGPPRPPTALQLPDSNIDESFHSNIAENDGFHTPESGHTFAPFFNFTPPPSVFRKVDPACEEGKKDLPHHHNHLIQNSQVTTTPVKGTKRSSPNDVTIVPEKVKHVNGRHSRSNSHGSSMMSEGDSNHSSNMSPMLSPQLDRVSDASLSDTIPSTEFVVVAVIGTGSFGTVYQVHTSDDSQQSYAIKRSQRQFNGAFDKNKMMKEVQAMQALAESTDPESIQNIVKYHSFWVEDDHVCIQMELCDCSVEQMLSNGYGFTELDLFTLLRDILSALRTIHRHDFVHLDVKPANIMKKGERYKLGDFGLALHTKHGHAAAGAIEEGDCRYMARELLDWGPCPDLTKCDLFSLGITAYEILTGNASPVNGPQWHALRNGSFVLSSRFGSLSPAMASLLQALLAPMAADRPSAEECLSRFFPSIVAVAV